MKRGRERETFKLLLVLQTVKSSTLSLQAVSLFLLSPVTGLSSANSPMVLGGVCREAVIIEHGGQDGAEGASQWRVFVKDRSVFPQPDIQWSVAEEVHCELY